MRKKPLTNAAIEIALASALAPLLTLYRGFSIQRTTVAARSVFQDEMCGRKTLRGNDAVFLLVSKDLSAVLLVRSDGDLHIPRWLAKGAGLDTDETYACRPDEKELIDFMHELLGPIEVRITDLQKELDYLSRTRKLVQDISHSAIGYVAPTFNEDGTGARGEGNGGGSWSIARATPHTVNLRFDILNVTAADAELLLRTITPLLNTFCTRDLV